MLVPDAALGAIVAALITGALTAAGLIISKENKTSEFRQNWIDGLRSESADMLANLYTHYQIATADGIDRKDYLDNAVPLLLAANTAAHAITLRLNPDERLSKELLAILADIEREMGPDMSVGRLKALERAFANKVGRILKVEWDRVRAGEPAYQFAVRLAKYATSALMVVAAYGCLRYLFG